jgi:SOS response regulatory protein OraA/RecX
MAKSKEEIITDIINYIVEHSNSDDNRFAE